MPPRLREDIRARRAPLAIEPRGVTVVQGDSREVLRRVPDASIDACVCDPPYALVSIVQRFGKPGSAPAVGDVYARAAAGFMGKSWDTGETAFDPAFWAEVLRVLKPGAHLLAFSATRTYHRLACSVEDAGFEIRDMVAWLYGSGFPKSHDVADAIAKTVCTEPGRHYANRLPADPQPGDHVCARSWVSDEWEGWGSALKPALEPVVFARKPLEGAVAANVLAHGTGALNIDGCRVATGETTVRRNHGGTGDPAQWRTGNGDDFTSGSDLGRWPANVVHDGSSEVVEGFPAEAGAFAPVHRRNADKTCNTYGAFKGDIDEAGSTFQGDSGSAARFFYSAKADAEDRLGSKHPTVKPVDLMAWLCRLVTPPGGLVLDPFAGSGTTGLAAMREGFGAVLIEREAEYVADIKRRIAWARGEGRLTALEIARVDETKAAGADLPLFTDASGAREGGDA